MLTMLLAALLTAPPLQTQAVPDSTYLTPALRSIVAEAANRNATPPATLRSYRARVETEMKILQLQADGREVTLQLEQVASDLVWRRDGALDQQVVGYRAEAFGPNISMLSFFKVPFLVPTLFADRLDLIRTRGAVKRQVQAVTLHPFDADRDSVYRFTGGDTVMIRIGERTIPIVRIRVTPVREAKGKKLMFEGDIDVDATRFHIVRMRGRLVTRAEAIGTMRMVLYAMEYVDLENAEYDAQYWLPVEQRFEVQVATSIAEGRTIIRGVSHFIELVPNDSIGMRRLSDPDSFPYGRIAIADARTLGSFNDWAHGLGTMTIGKEARDFDAYAPSSIRPLQFPGASMMRLRVGARNFSDMFRVNPVEGVFTGVGFGYRLGERNTLRLNGGYAWSEQTVRGGVEMAHRDSAWEYRARAARALALTTDFRNAFEPQYEVTPVAAAADYGFVDRRIASIVAQRVASAGYAARFEVGRAADRNVARHFGRAVEDDSLLLTGRADEGSFWIARAQLARNPTVTSMSLSQGLGIVLRYEGAVGDLEWHRAELNATMRRTFGSWSAITRIDAGAVMSDAPPPQALFELDRTSTLPGFDERFRFAGDRAVLGRAVLSYSLPLLRSPLRLGSWFVPALAPSPSVGAYVGWTDASPKAQPVLDRLGWSTTSRARTSVDVRMRFFGGGVSIGAARPLERGGKWRTVYSLSMDF